MPDYEEEDFVELISALREATAAAREMAKAVASVGEGIKELAAAATAIVAEARKAK